MSLNLVVEILNSNDVAIAEVELTQINTEDTFNIIGQDNNIEHQIERLISYYEEKTKIDIGYEPYLIKAKELRGQKNLRFTFIQGEIEK